MNTISVTPDKTKLLARFAYNEEMVARVRTIQGRVWAKGLGGWTFPWTSIILQEVQAVMSAYGPVHIDPFITSHQQQQQRQMAETIEYVTDKRAVELPADFKFNMKPYEHQRKAIGLCLSRMNFALFMEMGCVSGDTKIYIPGIEKELRIDFLERMNKPFKVLALNQHGQFTVTWSTGAFLKGVAPLYSVQMESGRIIKCTDKHVFLTKEGWKQLVCVGRGDAIAVGPERSVYAREKSIWGPSQSVHVSNDRYSFGRPQDCFDDCLSYLRLCDEQLHPAIDIAQDASRLRDDVLLRNYDHPFVDDLVNKQDDTRLYQYESLRAKKDFWAHNSISYKVSNKVSDNLERSELKGSETWQYRSQSDQEEFPFSESGDQWGFADGSYLTPCRFKWDKVLSVTHLGLYPFYDMHVPGFENYLANGIVNHNTGKTKCIVDMVGNQKLPGPVLVVCPVSVMENWKIEFEKNQPHIHAEVYKKKKQINPLSNVFVINYESAWRIVDELAKVKWGMIVLDESTKIKHRGTKQAKAILKLGSQIPRRYIMTGTPMPNNPLELFNQIRFLDPTVFGHNWYAFRDRYAIMGGYQGHEIRGWKNLDELSRKLSGISYRVLKKDCLDLPEKVYKEYRLEMDAVQKKHYDELAKDLVTEIQGSKIVATVVLSKLMKLRQITSGFVYDEKGESKCLEKNPKLLQLKEILLEILPRHKVVVWASFRQEMIMLGNLMDSLDVKYVALDGSVPQEKRQSVVAQFQTDPQTMVFLGQQHAGGLGITLTAGSYCVFFSNDYSPEIRLQAEDRLHRIGQKNTVTYVDLIIKSSIDTSIRRMLKSKQDLAAQVTSVNLQEVVYGNEIGG